MHLPHVTVRLNLFHVARLQLQEERLKIRADFACHELNLATERETRVLVLPHLLLLNSSLLLLAGHLVQLSLESWVAVDVAVVADVVPLARHDQVALEVDKHDKDYDFPHDARQDSNVGWIAGWATEFAQTNDKVNTCGKDGRWNSLFVAVEDTEGW